MFACAQARHDRVSLSRGDTHPLTVSPVLGFSRQTAYRAISGDPVRNPRIPMGSEKALQIALDCDPRTPLYRDAA